MKQDTGGERQVQNAVPKRETETETMYRDTA
jgi:hypothetical protein